MFSRLMSRMTYANVASTTALVLVIGGGGAAVAASMLPANSVGSRQIVNNSVKSPDLKNGGVKSVDLKDGGVSAVDLADGAIDRASLFGTGDLGIVRAYAWNSSPSANADLTNNGYTYNRSGGPVNVTHNGAGSYTITFAGLNLNGGNVVVSGYGGSPTWCTVGGWSDSSVSVRCFDAAGAPTDSYWTISASD
ncbi:hypothetical protein [Nocardioides sp. T2.26MG-1]|uniref:hypothetical protein n=1 Tax=Nocardioides sp. T2.26MG-1 TaxID=3041166 RepID=UPI002477816F|nr:hypothetical protein [Nocardioides sp. T2.26MG-1]CAI9404642.1 hypothetical protein HIDPHFAB_04221 [Nocardioides sp. T2.26MG-1]